MVTLGLVHETSNFSCTKLHENNSEAPRARGNVVITWPCPRPTVRSHHRGTNVQSHTFQVVWKHRKTDSAHQCCDQLTAVETEYPLTSIIWRYRGLRCSPVEVEYFLKFSADKLLNFKWSRAQVYYYFFISWNMLCLCAAQLFKLTSDAKIL